MKYIKRILLLLLAILLIVILFNYRKLNLIAGYTSKNVASSVFVAGRTLEFTNKTDVNFPTIDIATNTINEKEKTSSGSVFGLLTRKSVHREGLGTVLILDDADITAPFLSPKRAQIKNDLAFPYGDKEAKDSLFASVNYSKIQKAIDTMLVEKNQTRAVVVIHKDKIIGEGYGKGFDKNSRLLGWSMTKSVTATIFGVLQHQGKLKVTDKAPIKEWQNDERKDITIHNLLQMNSGLEWDENYKAISDATNMLFLERDMTKSQLGKPLIGKPNETWNYSSGTSNLLSGILKHYFDTHQEYLDFWYAGLIDKIGMHSMVVEADLSGNYVASSYSWATARDWSKLGLLYLHKGNWNGDQIFGEDWANYIATPTPTSDKKYGVVWLNAGGLYPDVPKNMYSFNGYQGQYVFIFPEHDLVIVRLGLTKNADLNHFLSTIIEAIE